jgi:5-methylcytosine-specific restriction endonuclease McrA
MTTALYINGIFEEVLSAIIESQKSNPGLVTMLQPYNSARIKMLAEQTPTETMPVSIYISTTSLLTQVSYRANIVGWKDKRDLSADDLKDMNHRIATYQPAEQEVYLEVNGKKCVNLIFISQLERLASPIPVECFIKVKDNGPLKPRTRSGGFSYVNEQPAWLGVRQSIVEIDLSKNLRSEVQKAALSSAEDRALRLAKAPRKPAEVQVISRAFRRNPDVIVEVLNRAGGKCEICFNPAPFLRLSDGSPYLEVHHRVTLSSGGDDTVQNAVAACPNCHRREHFGSLPE